MILRITDSKENFGINSYVISFKDLGHKEYHPRIAAGNWEVVYVDCNDDTPIGYIHEIAKHFKVIPLFDKENVTSRVIQVLCEIVPNKATRLRAAFISSPAKLQEIITELEESEWRN